MTAALEGDPAGSLPPPLVIGDLNSDLDFPRDRQEEILSAAMREQGIRCASRYYRPRRTRRTRGCGVRDEVSWGRAKHSG